METASGQHSPGHSYSQLRLVVACSGSPKHGEALSRLLFVVEANVDPHILPNTCWPVYFPESYRFSSVGEEDPIHLLSQYFRHFGQALAQDRSSWAIQPAAQHLHEPIKTGLSHTDRLEPPGFVMRKSSPNSDLINNSHFNSMFGTGESCQQKLWSLVPHPPTGRENTQQGTAAVSFI